MNEDNKPSDLDDLSDELRRLRPARTDLDPRVVFYEAGLAARQSQPAAPQRSRMAPWIAACLLAVVVTAPASYYVGQLTADPAMGRQSIVIAPAGHSPIDANVNDEPATRVAQVDSRTASDPAQAFAPPKPDLFSYWLSPLDSLAASAKLDREASTTLTVFHSSLVAREESADGWTEFPFPITSQTLGQSPATAEAARTQPLAVSDLHELAVSLEAIR